MSGPFRFGSVCSGIEAASVAWEPIGWTPSFLSEIDAFPRAVLAHRFPAVPLHGDFTTIEAGQYDPIDLLVGGTPCQSFSVAGLRGGLGDDRGNLALEYLRLADRLRPRWLVWENVPGVLSSLSHAAPDPCAPPPPVDMGCDGAEVETEDEYESEEVHAFACFLAGLSELGYGFAYRVLDAQYVRVDGLERAVPQRRQRVFVVGYLGDWRRAAAVLFERESLSGHPAPRREAGQGVAPTIAARTRGGGGLGTDFDCDGGLIAANSGDVGYCLTASAQQSLDAETETLVATSAAPPLTSNPYGDHESREGLLVAHSLRAEGFDASEDGTGRGTPLVPIAFSAKDHGADAMVNLSPTLRAGGFDKSHANAGVMPAIAFDWQNSASQGDSASAEITPSLDKSKTPAVAFTQNQAGDVLTGDVMHSLGTNQNATGRNAANVATAWAVRRLTPTECERLQGFPDGWTDVPYRGKRAADGPRYKALGNSMAVNVMRHIGRRIELVESIVAKVA